MTKRHQLKKHIESLTEIKNIVNAMKNLSLMEIKKVSKFLLGQSKVVANIESVAADFFSFYPNYYPTLLLKQTGSYIVIGSERGFCGNFNESIISTTTNLLHNKEYTNLILIGNKLASKFPYSGPKVKIIEGPSAIEEIPDVILKLSNELKRIDVENWQVIYQEEKTDTIETKITSLFGALKKNSKTLDNAPILNLEPKVFLIDLMDQYLYAKLYDFFYNSFISENQQRLQHMDGALKWIDKSKDELVLRFNQIRQEEITEEIEIILLSSESSGGTDLI